MESPETEVLKDTLAILSAKTWCQHVYALGPDNRAAMPYEPGVERLSLLGALHLAVRKRPHCSVLYDACRKRLREVAGVKYLTDWEDHRERTRDDVLNLLTTAIGVPSLSDLLS